jgi:site-specific recombinase XerD
MRGKRLSERTMSHAKLDMLIDYYLGDMDRRGCTQDSVTTNRKALRRFCRYVDPEAKQPRLTKVTEETVETFVTGLQHRSVRWKDHPRRNQEAGGLSPFTIRKEVRILKGFGTWLQQEGFENPFGGLVVPRSIDPQSPIT